MGRIDYNYNMRRDSIFYYLFQTYPTLLFELLPNPPANAANYRFDSVAVKEPKFEIDGVFLPPGDCGKAGSRVSLERGGKPTRAVLTAANILNHDAGH